MYKGERIAISNGLICILDMFKVLINPQVMKDEELVKRSMEYIESVEKLLKKLNGEIK